MTEISFVDNLSYPLEKEIINFEGDEPFRIYYNIRGLFKDIFELPGKDIFERELNWDATAPDKKFTVKWQIEKKIDTWTKAELTVIAKGIQNSETRKGDVSIVIVPTFATKVEMGFLQATFWWMYYFIFYKKKRIHDFYHAKDLVNKFKMKIGELYGMDIEESL